MNVTIHAELVYLADSLQSSVAFRPDPESPSAPPFDFGAELDALISACETPAGEIATLGFLDIRSALEELRAAWTANPKEPRRLLTAILRLYSAIATRQSQVQAMANGEFLKRLRKLLEQWGPTLWPILIGLL